MRVRAIAPGDIAAAAAIYGHHVLHGLGTFEETPPTETEFATRVAAVLAQGCPYVVAEADGVIAGYAYAAPFRQRAAYRYTVEDSVYVAPGRQGQGVGRAMLSAVIEACEALSLRQMIAVIGDSGNAGSIGLHAALGFEHAGLLKAVGWKHGRWVDTVWMTRPLGAGGDTAPDAEGLALGGA